MPRNFESSFNFTPNPEWIPDERESDKDDVDLRHESEVFLDHERIDNHKDVDDELAQLRDQLSEDTDGIMHLDIPAYQYDFADNPFVGMSPDRIKTYEISRYIDIVFLHRYMYQDIIVCGLQSRKFVSERGRAAFVKKIKEAGGLPYTIDRKKPYDIVGIPFIPFMTFHSTDALFRLYHTIGQRVAERPHVPLDVWLIYDARAYREVPYREDFRSAYVLRDGYSRRASLLGIAQIN